MIIEIANKNFDSNYNQKQEKNIHNTLDDITIPNNE